MRIERTTILVDVQHLLLPGLAVCSHTFHISYLNFERRVALQQTLFSKDSPIKINYNIQLK